MSNSSKRDAFKFLIEEFRSRPLPETFTRDLVIPLASQKIVAVCGPRRCGKSYYFYTLIKQMLQSGIERDRILYLNFEDDRILPLQTQDLGELIEAYFELFPDNKNKEIFLFLDEIQNVPGWEVFIRRIHDKEKVKIFLTGSSSKLLSHDIAASLRGRTICFPLHPLCFREYLRFKGVELKKNFEYGPQRFKVKNLLGDFLEYGGFPEVALESNAVVRDKILEEYFEALVFRDLAERHRVENVTLLKDLLKQLFTSNAALISVNSYHKSIQQSLRVSRHTVATYLDMIQETGYFRLLPKFSWSLKEQRVNPQKVICLDLGIRNRMIFRFSPDEGRAAEGLVGTTLTSKEDHVFYWQDKQEVDFVVVRDGHPQPINVTFGTTVPDREIAGLLAFQKVFSKAKYPVLITKELEGKEQGVQLIPLWKWLLTEIA